MIPATPKPHVCPAQAVDSAETTELSSRRNTQTTARQNLSKIAFNLNFDFELSPNVAINSEGESDSDWRPQNDTGKSVEHSAKTQSQSSASSYRISDSEMYEISPLPINKGTAETSSAQEARQVAVEDVWSSIFADGIDTILESSFDSIDPDLRCEQILATPTHETCTEGGLYSWAYGPTFRSCTIDVKEANEDLGKRLLVETNTILDTVISEILREEIRKFYILRPGCNSFVCIG